MTRESYYWSSSCHRSFARGLFGKVGLWSKSSGAEDVKREPKNQKRSQIFKNIKKTLSPTVVSPPVDKQVLKLHCLSHIWYHLHTEMLKLLLSKSMGTLKMALTVKLICKLPKNNPHFQVTKLSPLQARCLSVALLSESWHLDTICIYI